MKSIDRSNIKLLAVVFFIAAILYTVAVDYYTALVCNDNILNWDIQDILYFTYPAIGLFLYSVSLIVYLLFTHNKLVELPSMYMGDKFNSMFYAPLNVENETDDEFYSRQY
ncbi:hypothetical protein [Chryseobacterium sp.]|uniref:hypothetical protein n=1 Tax=Chryseobacterium sp. TaxID=1871047 RepID=UPI003219A064